MHPADASQSEMYERVRKERDELLAENKLLREAIVHMQLTDPSGWCEQCREGGLCKFTREVIARMEGRPDAT